MHESQDLWRRHARQWRRVGQPLRPTAQDIGLLERGVQAWRADSGSERLRALLLGVTPEIATMAWPPGSELLAIDRSAAMVAGIWPGDTAWRRALCADWLHLPLAARSRDLVVGDGVFNVLPSASLWQPAARAIAGVLAPGGRIMMRLFVAPARRESPREVVAALERGAIANFHVFKFRLAMAVQPDFASGVRLGAIWQAWHEGVSDPAALAARMGWREDTVATIEAYRDLDAAFSFPTRKQLQAVLAPVLKVVACEQGDYDFAECCPSYTLVPAA